MLIDKHPSPGLFSLEDGPYTHKKLGIMGAPRSSDSTARMGCIWTPGLLLPRCVNLGKQIAFSGPLLAHLQNGPWKFRAAMPAKSEAVSGTETLSTRDFLSQGQPYVHSLLGHSQTCDGSSWSCPGEIAAVQK